MRRMDSGTHKRVLRMMRENDLICRIRRRGVRTTDSDHSYPVFPNLIKDVIIASVNQVWVSDITYIRISTAFVYLAVILDLYSRKVGYHLSRHIDTNLTLSALCMAIKDRNPLPGCIRHSDQSIQYASSEEIYMILSSLLFNVASLLFNLAREYHITFELDPT